MLKKCSKFSHIFLTHLLFSRVGPFRHSAFAPAASLAPRPSFRPCAPLSPVTSRLRRSWLQSLTHCFQINTQPIYRKSRFFTTRSKIAQRRKYLLGLYGLPHNKMNRDKILWTPAVLWNGHARFPFFCKNLAVFASENPQILFMANRQIRQESVCPPFPLRSSDFINQV